MSTNYGKNWDKTFFQDVPRNYMHISNTIAQRLQTGAVDEERLKNHDQNWIEKLAEMDRNHTIEKKLDIAEALRSMQSLSAYSSEGIITTCPVDKRKIVDCYERKKGDTLKCESEVKEFISCIDNLMYKVSHIDERTTINFTCPKKMTYRERFEETCLNK